MVRIREANLGDLHYVVMQIIALRDETIWKQTGVILSYDHIQAWLMAALLQPQHRCWVADDEGLLVGVCGVEITTQRFIPQLPYLQEWAMRVHPDYRKNGVATKLWKAACEWGARQGAHGAVRGIPTHSGERMTFRYWGDTPCLSI